MAAACRLPQVCFHQVVSAISYPLVPSVIFCLCVNDFSIHFLFHIVFFSTSPAPLPVLLLLLDFGLFFSLGFIFFFFFWARELCNLASSCGRSKRKYAGSASVSIPVSGQDIYIYCLSQCVYTKIQLKLLETEVEDGAEEAEVTRKLLGHYVSSDSKSASEFESQRIPVKTLRPARALREIHPKPEVEKICVLPALQKKKKSDEFIYIHIYNNTLLCIGKSRNCPGHAD